MTYDLIILGGGPAGYLAAERAGHAGLSVLLIEKKFIGGVCLNEGCIPTKTLLYSAKIFNALKSGDKYGVTCKDCAIDHKKIIERKNKVVKTLVTGIQNALKKNNVTVMMGAGIITGKTGASYTVNVNDTSFRGKRLLIATGSLPIIPEIPGVREGFEKGCVVTNREILEGIQVPESLVVIGAGIVGLEFASYFLSLGSRVTVVEILPGIAGNTDQELAKILAKNYEKKGMEFKLNSRAVRIGDNEVVCENAADTFSLSAAKVLVSVGRLPVTEGLGLETIGAEITNHAIKTDEYGNTNLRNVFAAGDVNGVSMLAHTAYREAQVCVAAMLGEKDRMRYDTVPSVIYTDPEVASVGETEASARRRGIDCALATVSMRFSGRYLSENEGGDGICKVLCDKKTEKLVGVHMIGNTSSEIIYGAALMIEQGMRIPEIKKLIFPHPTVSEIIREAVFQL